MKIFTFAGWSNSGKTTLIIKLIKEFKRRNLKILALKNAPKKYYLEPEGKDSSEFLKAGADSVYLTSQRELIKMEIVENNDEIFEKLEPEFSKYDIIILEGLKQEGVPIIEVFNSELGDELKIKPNELFAIFSDKQIDNSLPYININDIESIANFLLN